MKPRAARSLARTDGRRRRAAPTAVEPHLQILHTVAEKVSRALRHMSTDTTEAFYARIRADDAFRDIDRAFDLPEIRVKEPA